MYVYTHTVIYICIYTYADVSLINYVNVYIYILYKYISTYTIKHVQLYMYNTLAHYIQMYN